MRQFCFGELNQKTKKLPKCGTETPFDSMSGGKRGVLEGSTCPTESRAGPGQRRGDKRRQRALPLERLPPKGREEDWSCSPDRSEDVLFCFSSALPLPAGSNITLGTKSLASCGHPLYRRQTQEPQWRPLGGARRETRSFKVGPGQQGSVNVH